MGCHKHPLLILLLLSAIAIVHIIDTFQKTQNFPYCNPWHVSKNKNTETEIPNEEPQLQYVSTEYFLKKGKYQSSKFCNR